jgi:hypothetical protein
MKQDLPITAVALLMFVIAGSAQPAQFESNTLCNVTLPDGESYGNGLVSLFGLWPDGTVVFRTGGPGFITRDGSLGMKFGWMRAASGPLKITGHRLDGDAPPLRAEIPGGYGEVGFQSSALIFPTPGCWRVNAQVGDLADSKLTFVTRVVKIGDGPAWRRN